MNFTHEVRLTSPKLLLVKISGSLDAGTSIELEMNLAPHLRNTSITKVVLDVPGLSFISSSGLRVIMVIIKALAPRKGKLYMLGANDQMQGLLKMSGMTKWVEQKNNLAECESDP